MASSSSPPLPHPPSSDPLDPPLGVPLLLPAPPLPQAQAQAQAPSSRRLPPPCWTPDETSALIDAYRDKWYSLRRGNLRAAHWQDVADQIHRLCPNVSPPKTAVQCRHKMEKLRKRYRAELQRAKSIPHHRFSSSWLYFSKMDSMEKGHAAAPPPPNNNNFIHPLAVDAGFDDDDDAVDDVNNNNDDLKDEDYRTSASFPKDLHRNGLRIRIASHNSTTPNPNPNPKFGYKSRFTEYGTPPQLEEGPRFASRSHRNGGGSSSRMGLGMGLGVGTATGTGMMKKKRSALGKKRDREKSKGDRVATEMVEAIRVLGDGFVRMEMMKMEMIRETERLRMDTDLKRTHMFLQSQHNLVQGFLNGWSDLLLNNHNHNLNLNHHDHVNANANDDNNNNTNTTTTTTKE